MIDCTSGHDWAPIGVYVTGAIHVPCRRKNCKAELRQIWQEIQGPGMSVHGLELDIEDDPHGTVAKTVCRETATQFPPDFSLKPGDVVIDIGAHVGVVSIYLAKRYPGIRVYAYEPVKTNFERLKRNIEANKAEDITAVNMAVTGNGRGVGLYGNGEMNSGGYSIYSTGNTPGNWMGKEPAAANCLDATTLAGIFECHQIDHCKVLKIDCEGAEYEILTANEELLDRVEYLRGEFHRVSRFPSWTPESLLAMCERHIRPENIKLSLSDM